MSVKSITKALGTVAAVAFLVSVAASPAYCWNRSASALFEVVSGNQLKVTLTNTSEFYVTDPMEVLTAVFFDMDLPTGTTLTPVSALIGPTSAAYLVATPITGQGAGTNVGGEWAYGSGLTGTPGDAKYAITSSGLNLGIGAPNFNGTQLNPPPANPELNGVDYGITSVAGTDPDTKNGDLKQNPLIKNQVVFLLSGLPTGFNPGTQVTNIWFQYGTTLSGDSSFPKVPEPAFFQMAGFLSLGGLGLLKLRRRRK